MVYKLVEGRPVVKRSLNKGSRGGRKYAVRRHKATGIATAEVVRSRRRPDSEPFDRELQVPLLRGGEW
jgi:nicotinate phosphoribosyltransferase